MLIRIRQLPKCGFGSVPLVKGEAYLWEGRHRLSPQFLHALQPHFGVAQRLCRALVVRVEHVVGEADDLVAQFLVERERVPGELTDRAGAAKVISRLKSLVLLFFYRCSTNEKIF